MHKIWMSVDFRQALIGLHVFLAALALIIHFTLLSTDRYNWMDGAGASAESSEQNAALPR